jgi:toxin HigB-1
VIQSSKDRETERFFRRAICPARWRAIEAVAARKLVYLDSARTLGNLRVPPGNRLEASRSDRAGQWSIRINDRWRLCFIWTPKGPSEVEITDYH